MKKQLLAIAIGAATVAPMAAMAEAELYGRFDVTVQKAESLDANGSQAATINNTIDDLNGQINQRFAGSNAGDQWEARNNKSRIGVRGSDDLDAAGLSAIYQLEMQFEPVDGNTPNFSLRNTFVGVDSEDYGKVFVGRYDSIVKQAEFSVDQFNNTDADIENVLATQNRYSNTINYHSPKFGPSLQIKAQVTPGESELNEDTGTDGLSRNQDRESSIADGMGISIGMQEGNMYGAIAYETAFMQDTGDGAVVGDDVTTEFDTLRVTGGLDGQDFGIGFLWEQVDGDNLDETYGTNNDDSRSGWVISGRFNPTEKLALKLQHGVSDEYFLGDSNDSDLELVQSTIGADYMLGKATKVYTFYTMEEVDGKDAGGFSPKAEFNVFALGMQHNF